MISTHFLLSSSFHERSKPRSVPGVRVGSESQQQLQVLGVGDQIDFGAEEVPFVWISAVLQQQLSNILKMEV